MSGVHRMPVKTNYDLQSSSSIKHVKCYTKKKDLVNYFLLFCRFTCTIISLCSITGIPVTAKVTIKEYGYLNQIIQSLHFSDLFFLLPIVEHIEQLIEFLPLWIIRGSTVIVKPDYYIYHHVMETKP